MRILMITSEKFAFHNEVHKQWLLPRHDLTLISDHFGGDGYSSNEVKTLAGIILAGEIPWSLHMDHDAYVDIASVEEYCKNADPSFPHGALNEGSWPGDPTLNYLSGACFLLSRNVRHALLSSLFNTNRTGFGDATIGLLLRNLGIPSLVWSIPFNHYVSPLALSDLYHKASLNPAT